MKKKICIAWVCMFLVSFIVPPVMAEDTAAVYTTKSEYYSESGTWYESPGLSGYTAVKSRYASGADAFAEWNIKIEKGGYYRVSFYNILHPSNGKEVVCITEANGEEKSLTFTHRGDNSKSGFENLGLYELSAGAVIKVQLKLKDGNGFLRADSVKLECFPYKEERIFGKSDFSESAGTWNTSSLLGYRGTQSKYGMNNPRGRWNLKINKTGIADLYIYNLTDNGNTAEMNVVYNDSDGEKHEFNIAHKGERSSSELMHLGCYDFENSGTEYVEVYSSGDGYMRINTLLVQFYSASFPETEETEYKKRKLSKKEVQEYEPSENAEVIYIKPNASGGDGSREKPYGTVKEAQEAVRAIKNAGYPKDGVCVKLLSGTYVTDTLNFSAEDSGTEEAPIYWIGEEGAVITTAEKIPKSRFSKVTDKAVLDRIPAAARDSVYKAALSQKDMAKMNISSPYVVSFDGTPGELSHWPNSGFERSADLTDIGTRADGGTRQRGFGYRINDEHTFLWKNEPQGYLCGYWMTPYTMDFVRIAEVDTKDMKITGANGTALGAYENARYRAVNMMCELDSGGEWYIEDGIFYAVMPELCENVYISYKGNGILRISGGHDIIFKNIGFKDCMGTAVTVASNSKRCAVIGSEVKNTSGTGIYVNGEECFVRDSDISYTGGVGIEVVGGNEYRLIPAGNYAENNTVTKTGRSMNRKSAVVVSGCANRISNNHIYDVPTQGISCGGMENIIEKNIVERTNLEMGDTGGIYFLNYGMGYGTKIRYNIVKDSVGIGYEKGFTAEGALGIYIDDMSSGVEVTGNIIYNVREPAIFGHGGRYLTFNNNVIINCDESIRLTKTGIAKNLDINSGVSAQNIRKYDNDTVREKYPEAIAALEDDFGDPKYNTVTNNVVYNSDPVEIKSVGQYLGTVSGNLEYKNMPATACTDFYDLDFSEIVLENPDFVPIDISEIGTYSGGARKNSEEIIFDNNCEPFSLTYPENGEKDVSENVRLKWENNGGIKKSIVYISEKPDMSFAALYETAENSIDLSLEYGKTYYWRVANEPFLDYSSRMNENEIFSFTTVGYSDKCAALEKSMDFLIDSADGTQFEKEDTDLLKEKLAAFSEMGETPEAVEFAEAAIDEFLQKKKRNYELDTAIFDDYSLDTVGEKPFGLFQRSTGNLDIKAALLPGTQNIGVKFNDTDEFSHYAARYFYPEKDYVEFATRVIPETESGIFSMSIVKARCHGTRDGISTGNAARVIFGSDGVIYADAKKEYPIGEYLAGRSYDVKIALDLKNKVYSVYLDNELKKADISIGCEDACEVGSVMYATSDANNASVSETGVFYIDNTIVRIPRKYGKNSSLTELFINNEKLRTEKSVIDAGLKNTDKITYTVGENAKSRMTKEEDKVYISIISGDFDSVKTYVIK